MPSEKRQRQDEGRMTRLEQQQAAERRAQRTRQLRGLGLLLVGLVAVAFAISVFAGDDDDESDLSSEDTTTTETADGAEDAFAYGTTPCPTPGGEPTLTFEAPFEQCIDPAKSYTATFETTAGTVVVDLDTAATPGTVNNFVALTHAGYYDDTLLFRTDPSIGIIQGGAPTTDSASDPGPGYTIPDEGEGYTYQPGQLVMARSSGEDSAGAQFFFTVDDAVAALDAQGTYVSFGSVTGGMDVLEQILASHQPEPDNPLGGSPEPPVTIESVTITES